MSGSEGEPGPSDSTAEMTKLIQELEAERKSTIVPILFTDFASIDSDCVSDIYEFLEHEKQLKDVETLEVILHSSGGDLDAALHLARLLRSYAKGVLRVIVPRYAKSAATLVAVSGNSVIMDKPSELGPLDPIWTNPTEGEFFTPLAIPKTIEFLNEMETTLPAKSRIIEIIAKNLSVEQMGLFKASLEYAEPPTVELLSTRMFKGDSDGEERAKKIANRLARGYPQHGYPIGLEEALKLGLKVERAPAEQWRKIWKIWRLFQSSFL